MKVTDFCKLNGFPMLSEKGLFQTLTASWKLNNSSESENHNKTTAIEKVDENAANTVKFAFWQSLTHAPKP